VKWRRTPRPDGHEALRGLQLWRLLGHWLKVGARLTRPPRIFHVNWFRQNAKHEFLWPGFGDNLRVLAWMLARCAGTAGAKETRSLPAAARGSEYRRPES